MADNEIKGLNKTEWNPLPTAKPTHEKTVPDQKLASPSTLEHTGNKTDGQNVLVRATLTTTSSEATPKAKGVIKQNIMQAFAKAKDLKSI